IDDITEFKRIEKDLFKSRAKLEKADRFKSVFLTNLSHEIRTPMNSILGYGELLSQEGLSQSQIKDYTSVIRAKGNYLLTLIDDVIELARFESGSIEFNYSEFLLLPLLKELYRDFEDRRIRKEKTAISIELEVPEGADNQSIYTDYGRLQQILSNLLSNALKFTERGKITFGYKLSSKNFKFFVSDTGQGLSPEDQKRIFNRFETIEETAIKKLSGTGLSLTISKHIVEQMGGKIKVKSELNKGSRFQLNIPIVNASKKKIQLKEEKEDLTTYNWKDKVILIAEDEDVNYRFLEAILQKTQAQILRAKNGQEAADLCKNINQIDIVLMDIKMPIMNGYDATIDIRKYRSNLPIIAQTAFASQEEIIKCQQVGCDDYITKPIDINILIEKINSQFLK
ncbi:MAG: ATP-binding protein, partial [Bacteroidales bacterium]